jgi:hypothetical protein
VAYRGVVNDYLLEEFGEKPLDSIKSAAVEHYKERLIKEGKLSTARPASWANWLPPAREERPQSALRLPWGRVEALVGLHGLECRKYDRRNADLHARSPPSPVRCRGGEVYSKNFDRSSRERSSRHGNLVVSPTSRVV